jgi:hypothetical protein
MGLERRGALQAIGMALLSLAASCKPLSFLVPTETSQPTELPPTNTLESSPTGTASSRVSPTQPDLATETLTPAAVGLAFDHRFMTEAEIPPGYQNELRVEAIERLYDSSGSPIEFGIYQERGLNGEELSDDTIYQPRQVYLSAYPRGGFQDRRVQGRHYWVLMEIPYGAQRQVFTVAIPNQTDVYHNIYSIPQSRSIEEARRDPHTWIELAGALSRLEAIGNQAILGVRVNPEEVREQEFIQAIKEGRAVTSDIFLTVNSAWLDGSLFGPQA